MTNGRTVPWRALWFGVACAVGALVTLVQAWLSGQTLSPLSFVLRALVSGPVVLILGLSLVLVVVALLQLLGVLRRVPFSYNLRNLIVRWKTTLLTALAFTLVVGLMIIMLSFVNGMYRLTRNSGVPGNVMVMAEGATDELFSNLGYQDLGNLRTWPGVVKDDKGENLAVWELYLVVNQPIPEAAKGGRKRRFLQIRGMEEPARSAQIHNLPLYPGGEFFSQAGVENPPEGSPNKDTYVQAVLGEGIARELGKDVGKQSLLVGDLFEIADRKWIVKGILQSSGSTFDSEIWAKQGWVGPKFGKNTYTTIVLRAADAEAAQAMAKDVTANYKQSAVQAQVESDYFDKLNTTNQQFLVAIIFVAVIMAIGGVFSVMNTMFAVISQRTKDIGVLRILGYSRWQLLVSFFLEALFLALLGGALGCVIGSLANGYTATSIISSGQGGGKSVVLKMVVDARILTAGMVFSVVMGCLGGLLPALSAMRLKPLDSLR